MGEKAEPLYDDETMRLMSAAYEAAEKELGVSDKALQVTMAVAIIRAINDDERDLERLTALAVAAVRGDVQAEGEAEAEPGTKQGTKSPLRAGWTNLTALLN